MFTKDDYINYFTSLEDLSKKALVIYTDLLNGLQDQAVYSKLYSIVLEEMETFKYLQEEKGRFA